MTTIKKFLFIYYIGLAIFAGLGTTFTTDFNHPGSKAEVFAFEIDRQLDQMEVPEFFAYELHPYWAYEIAPYFEYEGLTDGNVSVPDLNWHIGLNGLDHIHLGGYTYCDNEIWINIRAVNIASVKNDDSMWLSVLTHEMIHTLGGGFCDGASEDVERRTQLGTLEVLAAVANHKNPVTLYALLDELRDIAIATVWLESIESNNPDKYVRFINKIFEDQPLEVASSLKSVRFWANDPAMIKDILDKYNRDVFVDFQDYKFSVVVPGVGVRVIQMDDLQYVLEHLDEMAEAGNNGED